MNDDRTNGDDALQAINQVSETADGKYYHLTKTPTDDGKYYHLTMTPQEWALVPPHPKRRNVPLHAKFATHLSKLGPTHRQVFMGICRESGDRAKLDGHTRSYMWSNRMTDRVPDSLVVTVIEFDTRAEFLAACEHFDSPAQCSGRHDR